MAASGGVGAGDAAGAVVGTGLEPQLRPAACAGDGLGVEPAVGRVVVLGRAVLAHGEAAHGGVRAVVGQAERDGEARPAMGAVDERVAGPPVRRVEQLGQAVVARRDVGRHEGPGARGAAARHDGEPAGAGDRDPLAPELVDAGGPGRLGHEAGQEFVERGQGPFDLGEDALGVVADVPGQAEAAGDAVHMGPEADALDQSGHAETEADRRRRGQAGHAPGPPRRPRVTAASRCIRPKL